MITLELLQKVAYENTSQLLTSFVDPLNDVIEYYGITSKERLSCFLAQTAHESGGFRVLKENLNYSAEGLCRIFPKYFPNITIAQQYARQPQRIANKVYANRMGNLDEKSGDGYKFCGRGLIQITGKLNYTKFAQGLGMTVDECVAYMETAEGACSSAGWFWDINNLNEYADKGDFVTLTKRINGGTNGLDDRLKRYEIMVNAL